MQVELLAMPEVGQFRQRFTGQSVAMYVPVRPDVSQHPPLFACGQALPEGGSDVADERYCFSPISTASLRFVGQRSNAAKKRER